MSMLAPETVLRLRQIFLDRREADHRWDDEQSKSNRITADKIMALIPDPDSRYAHFTRQFLASVDVLLFQERAELVALMDCGRGHGPYDECLITGERNAELFKAEEKNLAHYLMEKRHLAEYLTLGLQRCTDPQLEMADPWIDPRMSVKQLEYLREDYQRYQEERENEQSGERD